MGSEVKPSRRNLLTGAVSFGLSASMIRSALADDLPPIDAPKGVQYFKSEIAKLPKESAVLDIPRGQYEVSVDQPLFNFVGYKKLRINGNGSRVVFRGTAQPFQFRECDGIEIRGLSLAWELSAYTQGDVTSLDAAKQRITVKLDPGFAGLLDAPVIRGIRVQRSTGGPSFPGLEIGGEAMSDIEDMGSGVFSFQSRRMPPLNVGDTLYFKMRNRFAKPMVHFRRCANVAIDSVKVTSAPQMAFVAEESKNIKFRQVVIARDSSSSRLMICNDGIHLANVGGGVELDQCKFSNLADDAVNAHSFYFKILRIVSNNELIVDSASKFLGTHLHEDQLKALNVGDEVELVNAETLEVSVRSQIVRSDRTSEGLRLVLSSDIPSLPGPKLVCSMSKVPHLSIKGCVFSRMRARGVLAHSNALIESCRFEDISLAGVLFDADSSVWGEGCEVSSSSILNCEFVRCGGIADGAISVRSTVEKLGREEASDAPVNVGVEIKGNRFSEMLGPAVFIVGGKNIVMSDNTFVVAVSTPEVGRLATLKGVKGLIVQNNSSDKDAAIIVSGQSSEISFSGNRRIKLVPR